MAIHSPQTETTESIESDRPNFLDMVETSKPGKVVENHGDAIAASLRRGVEDRTVAWIQGQSCSGCTVSLLQTEAPETEQLLTEVRESVSFHTTLMTASGEDAMANLTTPDVLVVEGSIPTRVPEAATIGTDSDGRPRPVLDWVVELGEAADVVVAAGTCAAFGGLPAAGRHDPTDRASDPTGAKGLQYDGTSPGGVFGPDFETDESLPVVNVSGCPIYGEHLLLTLATVLNGHQPALDEYNRPLPLFGPLVHDDCELRPEYECGNFADQAGDDGCLYEAGCAGVYAYCDGSMRLRNGGTTVCRNVGAPCIGCVEPAFWDRFTPFYENTRDQDVATVTTDGENETKGESATTTDEPRTVTDSSGTTTNFQMSLIGALVGGTLALVFAPLLPLFALAWFIDRDSMTGWWV